MNDKIIQVHDYFLDRLTKGSFEIVKMTEYHVTVNIDVDYIGYKFVIWIANGKDHLCTYAISENHSFMNLVFDDYYREKLWAKLEGEINIWKRDELLAKKRKELKELEEELQIKND